MSIRYLSGINVDNNVLFVDDANNRVGIGTGSPNQTLEVKGADSSTVQAIFQATDSQAAYRGGIQLGNASGNQNSQIYHNSSGDNTLTFVSNYSAGTGNKFIFAPGGTETVRFLQNGNVGIGTTNPSYRLDVDAVSATSVARFYNSSNTATQVEIGDSGNSQYSDLILHSNSGTAEIFKAGTGYSSYGGALALNIYNSSGAIAFHPNGIANAMFINTSGNVGIGTTAPGAKLQVSGTIATNSSLSDVDAYRIIKPNGGAFSTSTPSLTGAIRITYPVGFTNTMHRVKVNIYEYTTNESFTIYFGGYNYVPDSLWYNEFAYIVNNPGTDRNFTVRFGYNGTKMVVYIGELASTWAYPQVFIEEVELGFGGQSSAWRDDAWAIGFEATAFQNVSKTVSNPQATNWARNGSSTYYSLGNVGIGTTSPSYTLDIATTSSPTVRITRNGATDLRLGASIVGTGALIGTYSNSPMSFLTNSAARLVIDSSGNVGIGTTSPSALLNVAGSVTIGSSSVPTVNLYLTRTNGGVAADANYFVSGNNTPNQTWIEGGYYTGELAGVVTSPNSGYPYIETYAGQGSATAKSFGFVNKTSGSFISTDFLYTMALLRTGQIRFHQYGSGSFTGTVAYNLAVDSSGNIIETAGGVVDGSGTANYVSKWSDANTLTDSIIYDNGTNVGIGTTSPAYKLTVDGDSSEGSIGIERTTVSANTVIGALNFTNNNGGTVYGRVRGGRNSAGDGYVSLGTGLGDNLYAIEGGNVGIGTTSPAQKLHVDGKIYAKPYLPVVLSGSGDPYYGTNLTLATDIGQTQGAVRIWSRYNSGGTATMTFEISSTDQAYNQDPQLLTYSEKMRITASGNVGIGTTSPAYKLDVNVASNSDALRVQQAGASRFILNGDGVMTWGVSAANGVLTWDTNIAYIGGLTNNALGIWAGGSEKVRITTGGNVGIGTTSPAQKLQVIGNAWINRPSNKVDNNGATEFGSRVEFNNSFASNESGYMVFQYPSYNNFLIGGDYDGNIGGGIPNIQFGRSNGTVYMHIASSNGNVGIGTTAPNAKLNVNTNAMGVTVSDSSGISLTNGTAAAAGAQQMSPTLRWSGQGWATTPLASRNVSFISFLTPQQGTTNPSGILNFASSINGGAYSSVMSLTTGGALIITAGFSATSGTFTSTINNTISGLATTPTDGIVTVNGTAATAGVPVQISPRLRISGTAWNTGGTPASNTMNWTIDNLSTSGNPPTSALRFNFDRNGGGYSTLVSFISNGNVGIGTTSPTEKLHVVGNVLITGTLEVDTVNNGSGDFLTRTSGGIVTRRTAAEVRSDIQASQYFTVSSSSWIPASTSGWFRLASTSGNQRGSVRVILSFVGGNFTPQNYIIDVTKDWSTTASLRVDVRTAQSQYISGVRVIQDTVNTSIYHLEANFASSLNPYQFDLSFDNAYGFNSTWTMATTAPLVASTNGTVILSKDIFLSGNYSTDLINTGNINISGNTLSSINANGNIILSPNGSGNVGIGTTSPAEKLVVSGASVGITIDGTTASRTYYNRSGTYIWSTGLRAGDTKFHIFDERASDRLVIDDSGNVGIGTTSPAQKLTVSGSTGDILGITNGTTTGYGYVDNNGFGLFTSSAGGGTGIYYRTANIIDHYVNGSIAMRLNSTGNVGINNTAPTARLDIVGDSAVFKVSSVTADTSLPTKRLAEFAGIYNSGANGHQMFISSTSGLGSWEINQTKTWGGIMTFGVSTNSTEITRHLAIDSSGNVGIGNTAPTQALHVTGNARVTGAYYDSSNSAGSSGQVLSSTGSGTAWVNQGEATATSLYDLLPSARTTYAWSVQLTAGTWADIFSSNTVLSNGTWMVQVYVDDFAVGGQQYQETYSGIMSWGSASSTNETGPEAISEIILHRSGHAANTGNFYLRTVERASSTLLLQGMSNQTYSAASTINFKFVKIF